MHPRLLRHTPGTTETIGRNTAHVFACQHALVHYGSGAVFTFIPKNACTSLRVSLALANGVIGDTKDWVWVHLNNGAFAATLPDLARAPVTGVILRCPHSRLASTFLDKIVSYSGELWLLHRLSGDVLDPDRLTFRQFVAWIAKPGFCDADIHWRPQSEFLVYDRYDHVFGMPGVGDFAKVFEAATGSAFVDARGFSGHTVSQFRPLKGACHADTPLIDLMVAKSKGRLPTAAALYDDALKADVAALYADDLRLYHELVGPDGLMFPDLPAGGAP